MATEENKAIVRSYLVDALAEIRRGNLAATDEFLTGDAAFYDPGQPPSVGTEAQRERSAMLLGAFPDAEFATEDMIAEGDKVAARWTFRGTHQGDFAGIPPTGKQVTMPGIDIMRIKDSRIAELWGHEDMLGMLQQLGVAPTPGQSE